MSELISTIGSWTSDKLGKLLGVAEDVFDGGIDAFLDAIYDCIVYLLTWVYDLIFVDMFGYCSMFGDKILETLYGLTSGQFSLASLAVPVGFVFLIFVVKTTINIVRG